MANPPKGRRPATGRPGAKNGRSGQAKAGQSGQTKGGQAGKGAAPRTGGSASAAGAAGAGRKGPPKPGAARAAATPPAGKKAAGSKGAAAAAAAVAADRRRRNRILMLAALAVVAVVLLVISLVGGGSGSKKRTTAGGTDLSGVKTFTGLTRNHVSGTVDYPQVPPVGGDHAPIWENCGYYSLPVVTQQGVHSMEHGAVWVTYSPDLPDDQVNVLKDLAHKQTYIVVSPFPGLPSPVVASAWGVQIRLPSATDPRLAAFVAKYRQGPQAPEPGSPCTGGAGSPET